MTTAFETKTEAPHRGFDLPADEATVRRTAAALGGNGMTVLRATDAADAKRIVLGLIPDGAQVHHGASRTLDVTGITAALDESGRYEAIGPRVRSGVNKIVIVNSEINPGRITVVLVDEALGF